MLSLAGTEEGGCLEEGEQKDEERKEMGSERAGRGKGTYMEETEEGV